MTAWPLSRRRRRPTLVVTGLIVSGVVAAALATAGVAAWWLHRRTEARKIAGHAPGEASFDREALDRAADEGMAPAPDSREESPDERPVDDALPSSNGAVRGLSGIR